MPPTVVPAVPEIRRRDDGRDQVELRVDGARVSSCTLEAFSVRVGAARVPMAGLGNVETLEAHRMREYARRVLRGRHAADAARAGRSSPNGTNSWRCRFGFEMRMIGNAVTPAMVTRLPLARIRE